MNDKVQPRKEDGAPIVPTDAETEFLNCHYVFIDAEGDTTRRPSRGPIATQLRLDQPPPPPSKDRDKKA